MLTLIAAWHFICVSLVLTVRLRTQHVDRLVCDMGCLSLNRKFMMRLFIAGLTVGLLFVACAERQDEVEKLGQEITEQEVDSATMATETAPDSSLAEVDEVSVDVDAAAALAETETIPEAPPGEGFTVQVAACTDYEYAQYMVDLYRRRGYEPYMTKFASGGESYYRVRIGAYETAAEAVALKTELLDKYSLETWVDNKTE